MTPLRALIVDDEPLARRRLRALLKNETGVTVAGEAQDGPEAVNAIQTIQPDLVFLDVQMPGMNGFEVLEKIGASNAPAVIFVTAHDAYALRAFDAHAVDYLLKPFERSRLHDAVVRAMKLGDGDHFERRLSSLLAEVVARRPPKRLMVQTAGRVYFVDVREIDWIEAAGHYVTLHVGRESHLMREAITSLAVDLEPAGFLRIERGTLVNLDRVQELRPAFHGDLDVLLKTGARLRATRTFSERLRERLKTGR